MQLPAESKHVEGARSPAPLTVKITIPVGVDWVPEAVSATVAVQVEIWLTFGFEGMQAAVVDVDLAVRVSWKTPELPRWVESPE